jgi:hypothetical protein
MLDRNLFSPPAIIRKYEIKIPTKVYAKDYSDPNEKRLNYAFFKHSNKLKGQDGRTFEYIDSNGEYVSSVVSPYSLFIENNIEPGVFDLVISLINKGYLTCSSCQGHSDRKYRFVTIAFNTKKQLNNFKKSILKSNVPLNFRISKKKNQAWIGHSIIYDEKKIKHNMTVQDFNELSKKISEKDFVRYYNIMFLRNYKKYYLIEVRIASQSDCYPSILGVLKWIFNYPYYYVIYKFRNYYTKKLTNYINMHVKNYKD